jgi:hypothetical protein
MKQSPPILQMLDWVPLRTVGRLMVLSGFLLLILAIRDEQREVASVTPPAGNNGVRYVIKRSDDPKQFQSLVDYEWFRCGLLFTAGSILLHFCNGADRLDPFSPDFAGKAEIDELERILDEEQRKR